jgi:MYXO-CTERM domain-containing protein
MNRHLLSCVVVTVILATMLAGQPAQATKLCGEIPQVLIVLDRSGSMKEKVNGKSKWAIAKSAVTSLTKKFASQLALGLMLYPHWPETDNCAFGVVNVGPAVSDGKALLTALNSSYPSGNTPIAATIDSVSSYLGGASGKPRYVILVSDGKETCLLPKAPLSQAGSCSWENGTNYRKCGGCGWQFCLSDGTWSLDCEPKPDVFSCPAGQTCGNDALCKGTATGSPTAKAAAGQLMGQGVKTYVIGFGSQINSKALSGIASAGGTGNFYEATNLTQLESAFQKIAGAITCCGNGHLDPGEQCDSSISPGEAGACPSSCDDGDPCTFDKLDGDACNVHCVTAPVTMAQDNDGCCPSGHTSASDNDCVESCGNGVLDTGETCDPQIPGGQAGACDLDCDDGDPCTADMPGGDACDPQCAHEALMEDPTHKDGCCPGELTIDAQDPDCPPPCSPTLQVDCVDLCKGKECPDGQFCQYGECFPWPGDEGCDCRLGSETGAGISPAALLTIALLALLWVRRRR